MVECESASLYSHVPGRNLPPEALDQQLAHFHAHILAGIAALVGEDAHGQVLIRQHDGGAVVDGVAAVMGQCQSLGADLLAEPAPAAEAMDAGWMWSGKQLRDRRWFEQRLAATEIL